MGIFSEYIAAKPSFEDVERERKKQLRRIAAARGGRDILVYAADLSKGPDGAPISIDYSDLVSFADQLGNCSGHAIDIVLETPGGDGAVAEDMVRIVRDRYEEVAFIIPGYAKSAGTIIAMSGDEILMGPSSGLGPIDAQLAWQGKVFSAEALIEGMRQIQAEVARTGILNKAYIPILQNMSPGELQSAQNALDFAKKLVTKWLATYKFKNWTHHTSTGAEVTQEDRDQRAKDIADELCSHQKWLSHSRSIRLPDLLQMRLQVTDFTKGNAELADAISRYHVLTRMTFQMSAVCKLIETVDSQIYKNFALQQMQPGAPPLPAAAANAESMVADITCGRCGVHRKLQANFKPGAPLTAGADMLPTQGTVQCGSCGNVLADAGNMRREIEAVSGRQLVS